MSPFLQLSLALVVIIFVAKAAGYLSTRLGQPAVLGELLAGLLLGPTVLDFVHLPMFAGAHLGETIAQLAELGVVFLMFMAGLEVNLGQLKQTGKVSALAGILGVVFPVLMGWGVATLFGFEPQAGLFAGLILAATSVSISAQTLLELKVLRSRVGVALLGAVVFDDLLVILLLSIFVALVVGAGSSAGLVGVVWVVVRMGLYLGLATLAGLRFIPRLAQRVAGLPISEGLLAMVLVTMLFYSWAAEIWGGMAAIIGAFLAGLLFGRTHFRERIETGIHTLAYALFVPVFFVNIGLEMNARALGADLGLFVIVICLVAVLSKIMGSGLGARLGGFSNQEALRLGAGMVPRAEVALIVADLGLVEGLIGPEIFATVVVMVIFTTLITPLLLRALFAQPSPRPAAHAADPPADKNYDT